MGTLLSVSTFYNEREPMYGYVYSLPTNLLKYWTNKMYNGAAGLGSSSSDVAHHSEQQKTSVHGVASECGPATMQSHPL